MRGPQGLKGQVGEPGERGIKGLAGDQGPQGEQGGTGRECFPLNLLRSILKETTIYFNLFKICFQEFKRIN